LYKQAPPFGTFGRRREAIAELRRQIAVIDDLSLNCLTGLSPIAGSDGSADSRSSGLFLAGGHEPTLADCTVFPTTVFLRFMLPLFGVAQEEVLPPQLAEWFSFVASTPVGARIVREVEAPLHGWQAKGRWATILGAGVRDAADPSPAESFQSARAPGSLVYEDEHCTAFRDLAPQAPTHVLVAPKRREGLTSLRAASEEHRELLGHLLLAAGKVAAQEGLLDQGYRVVVNDGAAVGQTVPHLHLHLLGGRPLSWPPG
jgi:histidine triad (HIT) family protein